MLNHENWEYDIYIRIDEVNVFTYSSRNDIINEILWCYRFGYIDEHHRDMLMEYLDYRVKLKEIESRERHLQNMERIKKEQELLRLQSEERKEIKNLFLKLR